LERVAASVGVLHRAPIEFELVKDVPDGGVLFALPALLLLGLLSKSQEMFSMPEGFLSRPEQVVHFFREVIGVPIVSKEVLGQRTNDYQNWVEAFASNHKIPIEWAQKGIRKGDYVLPWLRRMRKKSAWSSLFHFQEHGTRAHLPHQRAEVSYQGSQPPDPGASM
jgi:hypothetical protein